MSDRMEGALYGMVVTVLVVLIAIIAYDLGRRTACAQVGGRIVNEVCVLQQGSKT